MYSIVRFASRVGRLLPLREDRRWLSWLLLRGPDLGCLAICVLEREVGCPHAELARRDLSEIVVARLDPELHRVERIRKTNRHAHVVSIELLLHGDIRHLHRGEATPAHVHWSTVEVVALQCHRR